MLLTALPENMKGPPLFSGLADPEKEALLKGGRTRQLARGEMLFAHGDPVTHFYMIVNGTIQLFRTNAEGHEKTIAIAKNGQTLSDDEIMDNCHSHRYNAVAVEDTTLMEFSGTWLKDAVRKHSGFALNLLSLIASRVHLAEIEAEHQATMSAAQMVACFMQRLCVLHNFDPKGFELPYSKTLVASRLGMELETFSRTLAKLKDNGIMVEGNHVSISDMKRAGDYVCGFCSVADQCTTHQKLEKIRLTEKTA